MRKSKGIEQHHQLASGCALWICTHRVLGLNPVLDTVIFLSTFFLENNLSQSLSSTSVNNQVLALATTDSLVDVAMAINQLLTKSINHIHILIMKR